MRIDRVISGNIRPPHLERIEAARFVLDYCTYTLHGHLVTEDPAVDLKTRTAESLANSRLVDSKRGDLFGVRLMDIEGLHLDPGGHRRT